MSWKCPTCSAQWPLPPKPAGAEPVCSFCARSHAEIQPDLLEFPYEIERIITFNVALKDVTVPSQGAEPDPLGFVSCMGAFSIETEVALVATSRTYSPKLLELERTIEPLLPTEGEPLKSDTIPAAAGDVSIGDDGSSIASTASKVSRQAPSDVDDTSNSTQVGKSESQASDAKVAPQTELKNLLVAYFYISDLASRLNMPNLTGVTKHALSLYRHCSAQSNMRNRHVESMATAALVMASRQFNSPRTIQEVAKESSVKMKEIGRYLKLMTESQRDNPQRPPENSHLVVEYVQRFCNTLGLPQRVLDVATHIATQLITQTLTTRQNPVSISAASIYITCLLEDIKRTQSDICKAAALTEVTLRKCYREVAVHAKALLPPTYVPAVPIDRALGLSFPAPVSFVQYAGTQQPAPYVPPHNGPQSQPISPRPPQQHQPQPHPSPHASQPQPPPPPHGASPTQPPSRTSPTAPPLSGSTAFSLAHSYHLPSYPLQYYAPTPPPHQKRPPD